MRALLLLLLAVPALAYAQAGRFLLAVGEVTVVRGAQQIAASGGSAVQVGDTIRVGARSSAQIRMSDETIVALRSGTVFRIDEHVYTGGKEDDRTVFSLLRGGMRAVTGAVAREPSPGLVRTAAKPAATPAGAAPATPAAKPAAEEESEGGLGGFIRGGLRAIAGTVAPAKHSVRLPTATLGIRGTHYTVVHCQDDCYTSQRTTVASLELAQSDTPGGPGIGQLAPNGSYGGVSDGIVGLEQTNINFGANQYFYIALDGTVTRLIGPPSFLYDKLEAQDRNRGQGGNESTEGMQNSGLNAEGRPNDTPTPPAPQPFIVTEQRTDTGDPVVLGGGPAPSTGFLSAFNNANGGPSTVAAFVDSSALTFEPIDGLAFTAFNVPAEATANPSTGAFSGTGLAFVSPSGNAIEAVWGRWGTGSVTDANGTTSLSTPGNVFHFLIAINTPPEVVAAKTGSLTYTLVPGTFFATNNLGEAFPSLGTDTLDVNFTTRMVSLPATTINFSSQNWSIAADQVPITVKPGSGAFFNSAASATCGPITGCTGSGVLIRTGAFMGTAGDHVGMALHGAVSGQNPASFNGTAIFTSSQIPVQ